VDNKLWLRIKNMMKGNKVRGKVPHGSNLNYVLKEVLKEHEKIIKPLKKLL
jgi:hypothetical protein